MISLAGLVLGSLLWLSLAAPRRTGQSVAAQGVAAVTAVQTQAASPAALLPVMIVASSGQIQTAATLPAAVVVITPSPEPTVTPTTPPSPEPTVTSTTPPTPEPT
ncbi:MAG: hypothetical protein ABTQ73_12605, partial [Caldilineales bacterium]